MSRFKEYITEVSGVTLTEFSEIVWDDCLPYLQAVKSCLWPLLYRGVSERKEYFIFDKKVRTNRRPRDMGYEMQKNFDDAFKKLFGWKPRSEGLFVIGDVDVAGGYANTTLYLVFPVGKFRFLWSPEVDDMYDLPGRYMPDGEVFTSRTPAEKYPDFVKELDYTDKDLCKAISSGSEIMIKCKKYHGIRWDILIRNNLTPDQFYKEYLQRKKY
jgi:hypothetical protein